MPAGRHNHRFHFGNHYGGMENFWLPRIRCGRRRRLRGQPGGLPGRTTTVGAYAPNAIGYTTCTQCWGVVSGLVWHVSDGAVLDTTGPTSAGDRVMPGCLGVPANCRSATRGRYLVHGNSGLGFRVVLASVSMSRNL